MRSYQEIAFRCEQGARLFADPLFLSGSSVRLGESVLQLMGGGGHMQGKISVEE